MAKYDGLQNRLKSATGDAVTLSFDEVSELVGRLPPSAYEYREWWANDSVGHVQSRSWLAAGWSTGQVNLQTEQVEFVRSAGGTPAAPRPIVERSGADGHRADEVRRGVLLSALFTVLRQADGPLPSRDAVAAVAREVDLTSRERSLNNSGTPRFETTIRFQSTWAVKIGWLSKKGGWLLTEAGEEALTRFAPDDLYRELSRRWREYRREHQESKAAGGGVPVKLRQALSLVEAGYWTSFGDLADAIGSSSNQVWDDLDEEDAHTAKRVLRANGELSNLPAFETEDQRELLEQEGVEFDERGRAAAEQRIGVDLLLEGLQEIAADGESTQRAWLVRGSSVNGRDLVPVWREKGSMSLAASRLRSVEPGMSKGDLRSVVEEDYAHVSYSARSEKLDEFFYFLTRMQTGDIVATTSQGRLYLGEITGTATYQRSSDDRSNLRRDVDWSGPQNGVDYRDLPAEVSARLQSQRDVLDLTQQIEHLRSLWSSPGPDGPTVEVQAVLPAATSELAAELHIAQDWLQECIDLLNDRPQLIFYGPPGTGKTFIADRLARFVAGDNVKLVQFHPAYSYEDFFEGYRPTPGNDGSIGFSLRPGPLRTLVDQAEQNPGTPYVLIIDEINRGNLAKIFGELYFLLEYRDKTVDLLYSSGDNKGFTLPKNVFIIGTMNTADRSIALVDSAMRRRFAFQALHPSDEPVRGLLRRWLKAEERDEEAADLLEVLNARIDDSDFKIGPSYFMREAVYKEGGFARMWKTDLLPLLEEHHYGDGVDVQARYGLDAIRRAMTQRQGGADDVATTYSAD